MRDYYSCSQVEMFLGCPQAYCLKYIKGYEPVIPERMTTGTAVHLELETYPIPEPKFPEFISALEAHLKATGDEIIGREPEVQGVIANVQWRAKFDALTRNGYLIDYKITSSPSFYANKVGYQLPLYKLLKPEVLPKYLLFCVDTKDRTQLKGLKVIEVTLTPELLAEKQAFLLKAVEMIEACKKDGVFPPTYGNCYNCNMSRYCKYFTK